MATMRVKFVLNALTIALLAIKWGNAFHVIKRLTEDDFLPLLGDAWLYQVTMIIILIYVLPAPGNVPCALAKKFVLLAFKAII